MVLRAGLARWRTVAVAAVAGAAVGALVLGAGVRPLLVTSGSMAPAVEPGEWIVVRESGGSGDGVRGDVVVFEYPPGSGGRAVKRVVAIAGDRVDVDRHSVSVNARRISTPISPAELAPRHSLVVPRDHVFLLGDNAAASVDGRVFGPTPRRQLVGRVLVVLGTGAAVAVRVLVTAGAAALALTAASLVLRRRRTRAT